MGGYAALQLGPNALNLIGGRAGAQRISESILQKQQAVVTELNDGYEKDNAEAVFGKAGNYFELLYEVEA
jgi:hypothetical protein